MNRVYLTLPALVLALSVRTLASPPDNAARITLEDLVSVEGVSAPVLSPDGREFAVTADGQIKLLSVDGGWPVVLTTTTGGKNGVNWSADGRQLAFVSQGSVWVVDAEGG